MADISHKPKKHLSHGKKPQSQDHDQDQDVNAEAQAGMQNYEAITITLGKKSLIAAYNSMWVAFFVEDMLSGTAATLSLYVTSSFNQQPLLPIVQIIAAIIRGMSNFTIAKILDVFGRPQELLLCMCIAVVGLILMAATNSVETYATAQVFYTVGDNGLQ